MVAQHSNISEINFMASMCRESYYYSLRQFWDVNNTDAFVPNWHINYICGELQIIAERVFRGEPKLYDLIINIPPGTTKSTASCQSYMPWVWSRMPTARFICGTHAFDLGMEHSRKCRDIVEADMRTSGKPVYKDCFPEIKLRDDQNTKGYYITTLGGSRQVATVSGKSPMGFHAHFLIVDDPIDPMKALSDVEIESANRWMRSTLPSRATDLKLVPIILIMQRLHQNDPTGNFLERCGSKNVKQICLPADLNEFDCVRPEALREHYVDGLLDPVRLSRDALASQRKALGEYSYAGQYGQSPIPQGGAKFRVERMVIDTLPAQAMPCVRYWDLAATLRGGCYTVGAKLGQTLGPDGRPWVHDIVRGQWDSSARNEVIRQTAEMDGRQTIIGIEQEPGSGGKEAAQAIARSLAGYRVRLDRPTGDKVLRADPLSSQVNAGNVMVARGEWNHDFFEEFRYFPNSTYKDQVDACSGAYNMLNVAPVTIGAL